MAIIMRCNRIDRMLLFFWIFVFRCHCVPPWSVSPSALWPDVCAHEVMTLNINKYDVSRSPGHHECPAAVGGPTFSSSHLTCLLLLQRKDALPRKWANASRSTGFVTQSCTCRASVFQFLFTSKAPLNTQSHACIVFSTQMPGGK